MSKYHHVSAVPAGVLLNERGTVVPMSPGPCLWCGRWVESERDAAGCTNPLDPAWASAVTLKSGEDHYGDFGCDESPETNEEGVGAHARPYDLWRLMKAERREQR